MRAKEIIGRATDQLLKAGIGTARLDALVLVEDITGIDRAKLLAESDLEISSIQVAELEKLLKQRSKHIPLAYVRGKTEFYGREFVIKPAVLEPRPESETMIDMLKGIDNLPTRPKIADVGAGSGALGITAAFELPDSQVELLEIDPEALKIAKINVDKYTAAVRLKRSDLLKASQTPYDVLLCNLPYVPDHYQINLAAANEPSVAIFGGADGLDIYSQLFSTTS